MGTGPLKADPHRAVPGLVGLLLFRPKGPQGRNIDRYVRIVLIRRSFHKSSKRGRRNVHVVAATVHPRLRSSGDDIPPLTQQRDRREPNSWSVDHVQIMLAVHGLSWPLHQVVPKLMPHPHRVPRTASLRTCGLRIGVDFKTDLIGRAGSLCPQGVIPG